MEVETNRQSTVLPGRTPKTAKAGEDDQRYVKVVEALNDVQRWYDVESPEESQRLRRLTMELVSAKPHRACQICNSLIQALAQGMRQKRPGKAAAGNRDPRGDCIKLGGTVWESRAELKARCQDILRQYQEESRLEEADDKFVRCVLQHHPRGKEKLLGCQGIAVAMHPIHDARCFYVIHSSGREDFSYVRCVDNAPTEEILLQRQICGMLCDMLQMHPAFGQQVAQTIEESFPSYRGKSATVESHRNWTSSILELCERMPDLTDFLLRVLVRRMVEMDTMIQRIEVEELQDEDPESRAQLEVLADILDAKMMKLFEFLQRHLAGEVGDNENRLAFSLFRIFESIVLLTHQCRCVQFLWFYLVSLRPAWAEAFLSLLLHTAFSSDQAIPKRLIALGYLASFIARAKFLTRNFTLRTAQYVATLARENLQVAEAHMEQGEHQHPHVLLLLYAVQAMCYILCFHAAEFAVADPSQPNAHTALHILLHEGAKDVGAEAFAPVLESQCNTIGRINKQVAEQVTHCLKSYCPALVAVLQQRLKEVSNMDGGMFRGDEAGMEVFFPFDPYRLRHSSMFVESIYRAWGAEGDDEESNMDPGEAAEGFGRSVVTNAREQTSEIDEDEKKSDVDFTDATDAIERGFNPEIQPSPAFQPRGSTDMTDIMSPLCMPMCTTDEDDGFALPSASLPLDEGPSPMLFNLLGSAAFRQGQGGQGPAIRT